MDTRQRIEPQGAPASFLQPWEAPSADGYNVVVPWPGHNPFYTQPQIQGFMPDTIGTQWAFNAQNTFDQSIGVVATFPPTSHMNYDEHRDAIAPVTPSFNVVGDSFSRAVAVN